MNSKHVFDLVIHTPKRTIIFPCSRACERRKHSSPNASSARRERTYRSSAVTFTHTLHEI